jgi:hypothetical protein
MINVNLSFPNTIPTKGKKPANQNRTKNTEGVSLHSIFFRKKRYS